MDKNQATKLAVADWTEYNQSLGAVEDYISRFPTLDPSGYPLLDPSDDPYVDAQAEFLLAEEAEFIADRVAFYMAQGDSLV